MRVRTEKKAEKEKENCFEKENCWRFSRSRGVSSCPGSAHNASVDLWRSSIYGRNGSIILLSFCTVLSWTLHRSYFACKNVLTSQHGHSLTLRIDTGSRTSLVLQRRARASLERDRNTGVVNLFEITPTFGRGLSARWGENLPRFQSRVGNI